MEYESREQQRKRDRANKMGSVSLEAHLRDLVRRARSGDTGATAEFQQVIQYAPPEMKGRMEAFIDEILEKPYCGDSIV